MLCGEIFKCHLSTMRGQLIEQARDRQVQSREGKVGREQREGGERARPGGGKVRYKRENT